MSAPARHAWIVGSPTFVRRTVRADGWRAHGLEAWALPWCEARPAAEPDAAATALAAGAFDLVMLTSANALAFLPPDCGIGRRAACVGGSTAAAARAHGFEVEVATPGGGGRALGGAIAALEPAPARVLWPCAHDRRPEAAEALAAAGIAVAAVASYRMAPRPGFRDDVAAAPAPAGVVLGSPRGVEALVAALAATGRALPPDLPVVVPAGAVTVACARDAFGRRVRTVARRAPDSPPDYAAAVAAGPEESPR